MPKNEIDYSNTIIYKIVCKDEFIPLQGRRPAGRAH